MPSTSPTSKPATPELCAERKPSWRLRRSIVLATLIFCALLLVFLAGWGQDSRLHETMAYGAFGLMGFTIAGYVFGAVMEDVGFFKHRR